MQLRNYGCQIWIEETIEDGKLALLLMAAFGFGGIHSRKKNAISFFSSKSQISKSQDLQSGVCSIFTGDESNQGNWIDYTYCLSANLWKI